MYVVTSFRDAGFFNSFNLWGPLYFKISGRKPAPLHSLPPQIELKQQEQQQEQQQESVLVANTVHLVSNGGSSSDSSISALAQQVATAKWNNGSGDLPPGWDYEQTEDGKFYFVPPGDGAEAVWTDPRSDFNK